MGDAGTVTPRQSSTACRAGLQLRCPAMYSHRFQRRAQVTHHAAQRMVERGTSEQQLLEIVDAGSIRQRDATHLWAWPDVEGRADNLLCVVLVLEEAVVVKTVMHHWESLP